jgi:hypothetical protein
MKRVVALALVLAMLGWAVPARALIGTVDQVPAATLLLPYFEVDLDNVNGVQTLFSINNASATAVLAHVTFWSDLSVPTLAFNVYLTGYDVQTINLRDIFTHPGNLPQTASAGQDPQDKISPKGLKSQDINFASCSGQLPLPTLDAISASDGVDYVAHLQNAHTGNPSAIFRGLCAGQKLGDRIARGYITVDTVSNCTLRFPGDAGYFSPGGTGDATNQNVLWGDVFYVNSGQNFAQGETLVHIEASPGVGVGSIGTYPPGNPATTVAGRYTFYGRYVNWTAADNREPLSTSFAARFLNGGNFSGGTSLVTWRDSKVFQGPFTCPATLGARPPWYPLGQEGLVVFDEQEQPQTVPSVSVAPAPPVPASIPFAAEANRTHVNGPNLPVSFTFGWMYLNLNTTVTAAGPNPPIDPAAAQSWVMTLHDASGLYSVGYNATQLDSAVSAQHFTP